MIKYPKGVLKCLTLRKCFNKNSVILRVFDGLTTQIHLLQSQMGMYKPLLLPL